MGDHMASELHAALSEMSHEAVAAGAGEVGTRGEAGTGGDAGGIEASSGAACTDEAITNDACTVTITGTGTRTGTGTCGDVGGDGVGGGMVGGGEVAGGETGVYAKAAEGFEAHLTSCVRDKEPSHFNDDEALLASLESVIGAKAVALAQGLLARKMPLAQLFEQGYSLRTLRAAGATASELYQAGKSGEELARVGVTIHELARIGFLPINLRVLGFSTFDITQHVTNPKLYAGCGIPISELKACPGWANAMKLLEAGYSLEEVARVLGSAYDKVSLKAYAGIASQARQEAQLRHNQVASKKMRVHQGVSDRTLQQRHPKRAELRSTINTTLQQVL